MVGTACFRLRFRDTSQCLTTVFLSKCHYSSPHPYFIQVIGKPHVASPVLCHGRSRSYQAITNAELCDGAQSPDHCKGPLGHTTSCRERGLELRCATIWHGLLPSRQPLVSHQSAPYKSNFSIPCSSALSSRFFCGSSQNQVWPDPASALADWHANSRTIFEATHGFASAMGTPNGALVKRDAMAASLPDGSWNVAWDARPARWLHGRNSAWLLFGVCNCFSAASNIPASPSILPSSLACPNEKVHDKEHVAVDNSPSLEVVLVSNPLPQRTTSTGYTVIGMPSDGRCLFRAIAYGACLRSENPTLSEDLEQELAADDLRNKVVDELVSRRSESEWFIEEDFDTYVKRMREPYIWGGEPELLMASHVLKMPITVHLLDKASGELISVAEYGKDYGIENPIRVLYHGFGHYDALQITD
ncbi:hypothetical protein L7F22_039702 [Adiantum nelumboides]|nr:hypothetical protein [Adiantum nelumboides]MCO5585766.1 hypothetical protein [Adiantum nelumboides]